MILIPLSLFYNFITGTREPTSDDLFQFRVSLVSFRKVGEAATWNLSAFASYNTHHIKVGMFTTFRTEQNIKLNTQD